MLRSRLMFSRKATDPGAGASSSANPTTLGKNQTHEGANPTFLLYRYGGHAHRAAGWRCVDPIDGVGCGASAVGDRGARRAHAACRANPRRASGRQPHAPRSPRQCAVPIRRHRPREWQAVPRRGGWRKARASCFARADILGGRDLRRPAGVAAHSGRFRRASAGLHRRLFSWSWRQSAKRCGGAAESSPSDHGVGRQRGARGTSAGSECGRLEHRQAMASRRPGAAARRSCRQSRDDVRRSARRCGIRAVARGDRGL